MTDHSSDIFPASLWQAPYAVSLLTALALLALFVGCATPQAGAERAAESGQTERRIHRCSLDDEGHCHFEEEFSPTQEEQADAVLPVSSLPPIDEIRGGNLLTGLHPELADRARLLYALLEKEGIAIVFISGHRPYDPNYRPNRLATWHNLGMAFDLNIVGRPYAVFEEDEQKWARIGEIATGLGMIWGIRYDDIFHFEWHPGYHARIREHEFATFQRLAGQQLQNHSAVFPLFDAAKVEPEEPHCFGGCLLIPDEGLRHLLEALRS